MFPLQELGTTKEMESCNKSLWYHDWLNEGEQILLLVLYALGFKHIWFLKQQREWPNWEYNTQSFTLFPCLQIDHFSPRKQLSIVCYSVYGFAWLEGARHRNFKWISSLYFCMYSEYFLIKRNQLKDPTVAIWGGKISSWKCKTWVLQEIKLPQQLWQQSW